jgi:hypothetical protein
MGDGDMHVDALGAPTWFEHGRTRECWVARGRAACGALGISVVHRFEKEASGRMGSSYMTRFCVLSH